MGQEQRARPLDGPALVGDQAERAEQIQRGAAGLTQGLALGQRRRVHQALGRLGRALFTCPALVQLAERGEVVARLQQLQPELARLGMLGRRGERALQERLGPRRISQRLHAERRGSHERVGHLLRTHRQRRSLLPEPHPLLVLARARVGHVERVHRLVRLGRFVGGELELSELVEGGG